MPQVNQMLPETEHLDVTLLTIMDIMVNVINDRAKPKSHRQNRITLLQKEVERVADTYHGQMHDVFIGKAEHLYATIEAGINYLLQYIKEGEPNEELRRIKGGIVGNGIGCGEGESRE